MMGWSRWFLGGNQPDYVGMESPVTGENTPDYDGMESLVHLVNLTENNVIELQVTL